MPPIPSWLLQHSAFLRETAEDGEIVDLEDVPAPEPLVPEALAELQAFVEDGTLVWSTRFWRLVSYFMMDGWATALDAHIRRYGTDKASVVVDAQIGKFEDWLISYTCDMSDEEIGRKGLFFRLPSSKCDDWARYGHLDCLQWARANGCPWDKWTCSYAAAGGHLEILQWARSQECPWNTLTCSYAAEGGHLELLQWARANGCPWNTYTCSGAAKHGHLDCLKWARENGCPWDQFDIRFCR